MTLIIGMKCNEGVFLVSDRKVLDGNNNVSYEYKLQTLYGHVIGAAGYSHLFKQFNRKIKNIVDQRLREIDLLNRKAFLELNIPYPSELRKEEKPKSLQKNDLKKEKIIKEIETDSEVIQPPYVYGHENFIEDCSELIIKLCSGRTGSPEAMLDVLLIVSHEDEIRLHHIDYLGNEAELDYCAIGSGSDYIYPILKKFYKSNASLAELIKLAFFCIYYVQELEFDNFVGVENENIPDNLVLIGDGEVKFIKFEDQIIKSIKEKVNLFRKNINSLNFGEDS